MRRLYLLWQAGFVQVLNKTSYLTKFTGMIVGLAIKLAPGTIIQGMVKFKEGFFFNLLLPPIILNSGYELKRVRYKLVYYKKEKKRRKLIFI